MSNYGTKVQEVMTSKFADMHHIFARTLAEKFIEDTIYADFPRYMADGRIADDYAEYEREQGGFMGILAGVSPYDYF